MTLEPDTSPVAISCTIARYDDGEPALDLYGRPTFILRAAHLDTGAVLTAEIPAGSAEALSEKPPPSGGGVVTAIRIDTMLDIVAAE